MCSSTVLNCIQQRGVADQFQVHVLSESRRVRFSTRVGGLTHADMLMRLMTAELEHKAKFRGCVSPEDIDFIVNLEK